MWEVSLSPTYPSPTTLNLWTNSKVPQLKITLKLTNRTLLLTKLYRVVQVLPFPLRVRPNALWTVCLTTTPTARLSSSAMRVRTSTRPQLNANKTTDLSSCWARLLLILTERIRSSLWVTEVTVRLLTMEEQSFTLHPLGRKIRASSRCQCLLNISSSTCSQRCLLQLRPQLCKGSRTVTGLSYCCRLLLSRASWLSLTYSSLLLIRTQMKVWRMEEVLGHRPSKTRDKVLPREQGIWSTLNLLCLIRGSLSSTALLPRITPLLMW